MTRALNLEGTTLERLAAESARLHLNVKNCPYVRVVPATVTDKGTEYPAVYGGLIARHSVPSAVHTNGVTRVNAKLSVVLLTDRLVPCITISVPPEAGPLKGLIEVIEGASYVN